MDGKSMTISQWAREYSVPKSFLKDRLDRGMSLHEALTSPKCNKGPGARSKWADAAANLGLTVNDILERRRNHGYSDIEAITVPPHKGKGFRIGKI